MNLHGISPTATSTLRVYQFRHDRISAFRPATLGLIAGAHLGKKPGGTGARLRRLGDSKPALQAQGPQSCGQGLGSYFGLRIGGLEAITALMSASVSDPGSEPKPMPQPKPRPFAFRASSAPVPYDEAVAEMEARVAAIQAGEAVELLWFLEHPPLYTAGTSADKADLIDPDRFPVFKSGRGGQYTYHGPGQRVAYVMFDLGRYKQDVRAYVHALEDWIIATLTHFDIVGETRPDRVGIWVKRPGAADSVSVSGGEDKIGALGVRVRRWIAFHGAALNVAPDLGHYTGIVPCGVSEHGVTSLKALGKTADMAAVDAALKQEFENTFGVTLEEDVS